MAIAVLSRVSSALVHWVRDLPIYNCQRDSYPYSQAWLSICHLARFVIRIQMQNFQFVPLSLILVEFRISNVLLSLTLNSIQMSLFKIGSDRRGLKFSEDAALKDGYVRFETTIVKISDHFHENMSRYVYKLLTVLCDF